MSLSHSGLNLQKTKTLLLNNLNEYYADIISQLNVICIHFDKLADLNKDKSSDVKIFNSKHSEVNKLLSGVKQSFQNHYLKLNEGMKNLVSKKSYINRINA